MVNKMSYKYVKSDDRPYKNKRHEIDEKLKGKPQFQVTRGETRGIDTVEELKRGSYASSDNLNKKKARELRNGLLSTFPKVETLFKNNGHTTESFKWIDQGYDGACTVTSLLNLLHLTGNVRHTGQLWSKTKQKKYWKTYLFNKFNKYMQETYGVDLGDYADMLDSGLALNVVLHKNLQEDPNFIYFPLSGLILGEKNKNLDLQKGIEGAKTRFKDYTKRPHLYLIANHIESLIDRNIPVGLAFNGHARIVVAYNETHLLFQDGWAPGSDQCAGSRKGGYKGYMDYYIDGFSVVEKFAAYKDARDLIYFDRDLKPMVDMTMEELSKQVKMITVGPVKTKKAPKKKKKGKRTKLERYKDKVEVEIEEMKKLLADSAEQREKSITDSLIGRGKPEEPQRTSINRALNACVCVESNGSGSIVTHNGKTFVLTNEHVASEIGTIKFIMWIDGKIGYAQTYWVDEENDIGKMKIIENPKDKVISSLSIHTKKVTKGQLLVQIHNPYHWYNDKKTGDRQEIDGHFPFTVETRNIHPGKLNDFSHSSTEDSSVFGGSSGSPLIYRDTRGILGGVVGIHKQYYYDTGIYEGVLINDTTLNVLPKLKF